MDNQELKEFIGLVVGNLTSKVDNLTGLTVSQGATLRNIELENTSLRKDVETLRGEIKEVKADQKSMDESQKLKWKELSKERSTEKQEQSEKDEKQAVVNSSISTINRLLWVILGVVLSIGIGFIWDLIVNGGIKGIVP